MLSFRSFEHVVLKKIQLKNSYNPDDKMMAEHCLTPFTAKGSPFDEWNCLALGRVKSVRGLRQERVKMVATMSDFLAPLETNFIK